MSRTSSNPLKRVIIGKPFVRLKVTGITVFLIAYLVMLFCWPWAQENPFLNPVKAVMTFSDFPQDVEVLLNGFIYKSTELPWTYLPVYFYVQLPVLQLFLIVVTSFFCPSSMRICQQTVKKRRWF